MWPTIANGILAIAALNPSNSAFNEISTIPMKLYVPLCGSTDHSRLFLREPEILAELEQRTKSLEGEDEPEVPPDYASMKRANLRPRGPS